MRCFNETLLGNQSSDYDGDKGIFIFLVIFTTNRKNNMGLGPHRKQCKPSPYNRACRNTTVVYFTLRYTNSRLYFPANTFTKVFKYSYIPSCRNTKWHPTHSLGHPKKAFEVMKWMYLSQVWLTEFLNNYLERSITVL